MPQTTVEAQNEIGSLLTDFEDKGIASRRRTTRSRTPRANAWKHGSRGPFISERTVGYPMVSISAELTSLPLAGVNPIFPMHIAGKEP